MGRTGCWRSCWGRGVKWERKVNLTSETMKLFSSSRGAALLSETSQQHSRRRLSIPRLRSAQLRPRGQQSQKEMRYLSAMVVQDDYAARHAATIERCPASSPRKRLEVKTARQLSNFPVAFPISRSLSTRSCRRRTRLNPRESRGRRVRVKVLYFEVQSYLKVHSNERTRTIERARGENEEGGGIDV